MSEMSPWFIRRVPAAGCFLAGAASIALLTGAPAGAPNNSDRAFTATVQPFLAKNCYTCHGDQMQSGGLNLQAWSTATAANADRDHQALVLDKLRNSQMPPPGMPQPTNAEKQPVIAWLEAELARTGQTTSATAGRVTARRLNRTEYDNTVRDLLGVGFQPAADFPPDDSGYGFDNIGDVLSMSPALMEKYVSAAEKVARAAVFGPPALKPTLVKHEPWYVDFATKADVKTDYDETGLSLPSALHVTHQFPVEGDYDVAGLLRGTRPDGSEPLQVAFWVDGKQVKTLEYPVPPGGEVSGQRREFRLHFAAGEHAMSVSFLKVYEGLPVAYKGPKPSKLPPPPARGGASGRGAAGSSGAGRGPGRGVLPGPGSANNEFAELAAPSVEQGGGLPRGASTAFFISNLEVTGPFHQVTGPSAESRKLVFSCTAETSACAREILSRLARQAYRRPATTREVTQLTGLVAMVRSQGDSFNEGLCLAIQKILISPNFLFRIERDRAPGGASNPVSDYELATRLSYFLWSSMPDDELLQAAVAGSLRHPHVLAAEVRRMLASPKADALTENFGGQWLEFRGLESHLPDRKRFQEYTEYTRMSIAKETELFFGYIMRQDRSVLDFIDADYTFLNDRLADFYGIPGVKGAEFRKVDLSATPRRGVLTQASVLTVSSYANRTSPVLRGKWVLENILNTPPPPPPPNVPSLDDSGVGATVSLREQLEKHRANAVCASCHSRMDPLGFSLENYDAIGQWRDKDGKFVVDASGKLPDGRTFSGAQGLVKVLDANPNAFAQAITEKMLTYALGRGVEPYDKPAVTKIVAGMAANGYKFSSLVLGIAASLPFEERSALTSRSALTIDSKTLAERKPAR